MNELFRPDADIVFFLLLFVDSQEFWLKFADFWAPTRKMRSGLAHLYAFCKGGDGEVAAQLFCAPRVSLLCAQRSPAYCGRGQSESVVM